MTNERAAIDPDLLLSQTSWVRTLSRSLVRDPLGAEDVAQETLLAALTSPPRTAENVHQLRAWLGRVAFNLAHRATRRDLRQRAREAIVARSESLESTAEGVARSNEIQRVAAAVAQLEEPYRTAVLLYYFQKLSTAEIAVRTDTTDNAVRKRLWRARAKLRALLEREPARPGLVRERRALVPALFPWLAWRAPRAGGAPVGPTAAGLGWKAAAGLAAAAALVAWAAEPGGSPGGSHGRPAGGPQAELVALAGDAGQIWRVESARDPLARGRTPVRTAGTADGTGPAPLVDPLVPPPPRDPGEEPALLARGGRVLDLTGAALAGVGLVRADDPAEVLATSDGHGRFELALAAGADLADAVLLARAAGWTTVRAASLAPGAGELLVVAAPGAPVRGLVLDPGGRPLAGARLEILLDPELFLHLDEPLDLTRHVPREARSDAAGRFDLGTSVVGDGVRLRAELAGHHPSELLLAAAPGDVLVVTLRPRAAPVEGSTLRGVVLDPQELPIPGARVSLGAGQATRTALDGSFALPASEVDPGAELVVEKEGFEARRIEGFGALLARRPADLGPPPELQIHLGTGRHAIHGRIVGAGGAPAAGWRVHVVEAGEPGLAALRAAVPAWGRRDPGVGTDAEGAFRLEGLADRAFLVVAHDPRTLAQVRSAPVRAGGGALLLRAPEGAVQPRPGRLERPDGTPLAGARLALELRLETPAGAWHEVRYLGQSDADGGFALPSLPAGTGRLQVVAPGTTGRHGLTSGEDGGGAWQPAIVVPPDAFLSVVGGPAEDGAAIRLLRRAAQGEGPSGAGSVEAVLLDDGLSGPRTEVRLHGGRSLALRAPAGAYEAVFLVDGVEVGRTEVELVPGELVRLRP